MEDCGVFTTATDSDLLEMERGEARRGEWSDIPADLMEVDPREGWALAMWAEALAHPEDCE